MNKRCGANWACLTHCTHAEFICKVCVEQSAVCQVINLSSDFSLTFVERLSFGASDARKQPYYFARSVLGAQMKAIAAVGRGLL